MPDVTLQPDLGRTLSQLTARVERLERRTVPNDALEDWLVVSGEITIGGLEFGYNVQAADPHAIESWYDTQHVDFAVRFRGKPLLTCMIERVLIPGEIPVLFMLTVSSWDTTVSGGVTYYTGATFSLEAFGGPTNFVGTVTWFAQGRPQ